MRNVRFLVGLAAIMAASTSCGSIAQQGRSPVYLVIDSLTGQRGGLNGNFGNPVPSDVVTNVTSPAPCTPVSPCATVFSDNGQVALRAEMKDPTSLTAPTATNDVTIFRYHVSYRRSDGRNTQGVDVPFAWDGAVTGTVRVGSQTTLPFELVRIVAKEESPLVNLVSSLTIVTTIAEVTFYGRDQAGNMVSVVGLIQVDFGNFGDF
jgi:hypothetical protein